jgi:hypothetical protein
LFQFGNLFEFKICSVSKNFEILKTAEIEKVKMKQRIKKQRKRKNKKGANAQWAKPTTSQGVRRPVLSDQVGVQARP